VRILGENEKSLSREEIEKNIYMVQPELREFIEKEKTDIEEMHGHDVGSVITSERYAMATNIASRVTRRVVSEKTLKDRLEAVSSHPILGYFIMVVSILAVFYSIFSFGDWFAGLLDKLFGYLRDQYYLVIGVSDVASFFWDAFGATWNFLRSKPSLRARRSQ